MKNLYKHNLAFVRPRDIQKIYGISRQTAWRYVRNGSLAPPTQISPRICGWDRATLDDFFCIVKKIVHETIEINLSGV